MKLHIAVDALGLPYAAMVTTANISDIAGGIQMFSQPSFYSFSTVETALVMVHMKVITLQMLLKSLLEQMSKLPNALNYILLQLFPKGG